ncbi:MAG: GNAT family N-acetyltransferase, partial [Acidobacteria bacterium]|nr:GNAT family N-acetyltransferase [Acidobacteriota bacterium]
MKDYRIESWPPTRTLDTDLNQLATLLHATVHDGASVSFILPFTHDDSLEWWRSRILPQAMTYQRQILIARHTPTGTIVGSVQLILDMPPNQQHRAEVAKLLVHPDHRRHGLARALMTALEHIAIDENRSLIT